MLERAKEDAAREMADLRRQFHEEKERYDLNMKEEHARVLESAKNQAVARKAVETAAQEAFEKVKSVREESAAAIADLQSKLEECLSARATKIEMLETDRDSLTLSIRRKDAEHLIVKAQLESNIRKLDRERERALQRERETRAIVEELQRGLSGSNSIAPRPLVRLIMRNRRSQVLQTYHRCHQNQCQRP